MASYKTAPVVCVNKLSLKDINTERITLWPCDRLEGKVPTAVQDTEIQKPQRPLERDNMSVKPEGRTGVSRWHFQDLQNVNVWSEGYQLWKPEQMSAFPSSLDVDLHAQIFRKYTARFSQKRKKGCLTVWRVHRANGEREIRKIIEHRVQLPNLQTDEPRGLWDFHSPLVPSY